MKLIAKLTKSQRENLQESLDDTIESLRPAVAYLKVQLDRGQQIVSVREEISLLTEKADKGNREASREILAANDELQRLIAADERHDKTLPELVTSINDSSLRALTSVQEYLLPFIDAYLEELTDLLAPHFEKRIHARLHATQIHAYDSLAFDCKSKAIVRYEDLGRAVAQLKARSEALQSILAGVAWEFKGSDLGEAAGEEAA